MRDFMEFFVPLLLMLGVLLILLVGVFVSVDYLDCRGFNKGTGIETKWSWGCYANVDGKWVPKAYAFGNAHEVRVKK